MIVVKIKDEFRKLLESDDIPELVNPSITNPKEYDPELQLEDDEWFFIDVDSDHMPMITDYSNFFTNTVSLNDVSREEFSKIDVIFKQLENGNIVFQKVTASKRLIDKSILKWTERTRRATRTIIENGIEIKNSIDAYFDDTDKKLYFKNFSTIRGMFKNIEDYYRVATVQELNRFTEASIILCNTSTFKVGNRNLKMIAVLISDEDIDLENSTFIQQMLNTYGQYPNQSFQVANGQFIVNSNQQLTSFFKLALGRLYTNPITHKKMEASSAKKLN